MDVRHQGHDHMEPAAHRPVRLLALATAALVSADFLNFLTIKTQPANLPFSDKLIDINHDSAADLQILPGIGPSIARRVIAQREIRPFTSTLDFESRVRGVGPSFMMNYADWIQINNSGHNNKTDKAIQITDLSTGDPQSP